MLESHPFPLTAEQLQAVVRRSSPETKLADTHAKLNPPMPAGPDEAAGVALSAILDPSSPLLPADVFKELARRNTALVAASEGEIKNTLARQVALLEATATRLMHKAATTTKPSASAEFLRAGLATQRVLIAALGAIHQMNNLNDETADALDA